MPPGLSAPRPCRRGITCRRNAPRKPTPNCATSSPPPDFHQANYLTSVDAMIRALTLLLVCQLAGEFCSHALGLPVPGPVIGLALLAAGAMIHARVTGAETAEIEKTDLGIAASALIGSL